MYPGITKPWCNLEYHDSFHLLRAIIVRSVARGNPKDGGPGTFAIRNHRCELRALAGFPGQRRVPRKLQPDRWTTCLRKRGRVDGLPIFRNYLILAPILQFVSVRACCERL